MVLKSINKQISDESYHFCTLCTNNTIYDKYIDAMGQYETHLISIFMNIIKMSKIGVKTREKTIAIERFLVRYIIVLAF